MDGPAVIPPAPREPRGTLADRGAVALAVAVVAGAWWHGPIPLVAGLAASAAAFVIRRPTLLVLGGFLLAAALGARSVHGMDPVTAQPYEGPVTLLSDPTEMPFGVRVDVRVGRRRVELEAMGAAGGTVDRALAGERLSVAGHLRPPPPDAPWLVPRHVVGRLVADHAEALDGGAPPWRAANRLRRLLGRGAEEGMDGPARSLYSGFVLGDDRGQSPGVVDDFRGSGLTHLLVVSGQNVAFLLVLVSPLTNRLSLAGRWLVILAVIGAFALLTRFEPSVLRASAMAALAVTAAVAGRPAATLRTLALAVTALVLVDPLLVRSVAFQLSVAASLGIAVLGPPIVAELRGPRWWREALGVTVAAQLGVAPVLVPRFGGLPVVSIAANVLCVPVAGLVTTWGLPAGVVAGVGGSWVASIVHWPTGLLIGWVAGVARIAAAVPLGDLGITELAVVAMAGATFVMAARHRPHWRWARLVALAVVVVALVVPAVSLHQRPPRQATEHATVYRSGGVTVVVLEDRTAPSRLLEELRRAGVRRIDLLVTAGMPDEDTLGALRHRWMVAAALAVDEVAPGTVAVGDLVVEVDGTGDADRPGQSDRTVVVRAR